MRIVRFAAVVALAAAAAACSTSAGSDPDRGSTATHPSQGGSAAPQTMTSRADLVSPRPLRWDSWRLVDPTTVEITFLAGPADCDGVEVTPEEAADHVTISLLTGALPGSGECRAIALTTTAQVRLLAPLGDRKVRQP